jgi:hypothetical protein
LSANEQKVIKEKERIELLQNSKTYLDSIDKIYNKITFIKVLYQGIGHTNRTKKENWFFEPVLALIDPVAIGGWRLRYGMSYYKKFENKKTFSINSNATYGFLNKDLKGLINSTYFYNPIKQSRVRLSFGSSFNVINGAATISDIIRRSNFYENNFVSLGHRTELFNGFYVNADVYYEKRSDLSNFKFNSLGDKLFSNNRPEPFPTGYTYKTIVDIDYTPQQLYLREPDQKIILGSSYPTFNVTFTRAWPVKQQLTNAYSYLSLGMKQSFNVGVFGISEYNITAGKFLDTTSLAPMDYRYMRGGDSYFFSPAMYTFQLIPKTFRVFDWFFESHYTHQFNGYLTSKIPLLNKTGIKEMAGGGFLYVPERKYQYSEIYGGINRIFKVGRERFRLGMYYVVAQSNDFGLRNMIKFSFESYNQYRNTWSF